MYKTLGAFKSQETIPIPKRLLQLPEDLGLVLKVCRSLGLLVVVDILGHLPHLVDEVKSMYLPHIMRAI